MEVIAQAPSRYASERVVLRRCGSTLKTAGRFPIGTDPGRAHERGRNLACVKKFLRDLPSPLTEIQEVCEFDEVLIDLFAGGLHGSVASEGEQVGKR